MINLKYLTNVFLYFSSTLNFEYLFLMGFYYLIQDYFIFLLSFFKDFAYLDLFAKENLKLSFFVLVFLCSLF